MIKVYAIEERQDVHEIEDNEFIEIAKEQGTTWELSDFQNFINWEGSPPFYQESENLCFRFIDVQTEKNELSDLEWFRKFAMYIDKNNSDLYNCGVEFADCNCGDGNGVEKEHCDCDRCDGSGKSRSQDLQSDICSDCDGSGKKSDDEKYECSECSESFIKDGRESYDVFENCICYDCVIETHFFCVDCDELSPMDMATENTEDGFQCVKCWEENPKEIISIRNGIFYSSIEDDWNGRFENISRYWVEELNHRFQGCNCDNINDYKVFSYITYAYDLMDNYRFEDSAFHNDLVPSMVLDVRRGEDGMGQMTTYWVGFPNSNDRDEENEEWNYFTINWEDEDTKEYFSSLQNDIVFETIEDVLGFIESNKNENGGLI